MRMRLGETEFLDVCRRVEPVHLAELEEDARAGARIEQRVVMLGQLHAQRAREIGEHEVALDVREIVMHAAAEVHGADVLYRGYVHAAQRERLGQNGEVELRVVRDENARCGIRAMRAHTSSNLGAPCTMPGVM